MTASTAQRPVLSLKTGSAVQGCTIVRLEVSPGGVDHFPARDNNYIYTSQWFTDSKQLADDPFGSIACDSIPNFLAGGDSEPRGSKAVREDEPRHEPAPQPGSLLIHLLELRSALELFLTQWRGPHPRDGASANVARSLLNGAGPHPRDGASPDVARSLLNGAGPHPRDGASPDVARSLDLTSSPSRRFKRPPGACGPSPAVV
jgi:hypothetical protein